MIDPAVPRLVLTGHNSGFPVGVVVLALVGVALVPVFVLVEKRLGEDDDDHGLGSAPGVEVDPETGAATLPDGTTLDPDEAAAVAAVYDYFDRRPAAPREEIRRACFGTHPAGFEDATEWWDRLVQPAITCIAEAATEEPTDVSTTEAGEASP